MADIKSIFNHPKRTEEKSQKEEQLYDWQRPAYKKDDVGNLNRILKNLASGTRAGRHKSEQQNHGFGYGSYGDGFHARSDGSVNSRKQRVIFKMSLGHSLKSHKRYLETYMPQSEKTEVAEKPELFGTDLSEYEANISKEHFKCIISPESQNVDLRLLTAKLIERLENMTGYKLYWQACIHTNTPHRHAHLAINGTDRNGRKVRFSREVIKTQIRNLLSDMTTAMVGERTYEEIQAAKEKLPQSARWTSLDDRLMQFGETVFATPLYQNLQNRLAYLATVKLAKKDGAVYTLNPEWQEVLKAAGRFNSFFEEYIKPNPLPLHLYDGGSLFGVVECSITFDKDESWNDAVIIRTGKVRVYVPVYQLHKEKLEGKTVRIDSSSGGLSRKITDRNIKVISEKSFNIER